MFLTGKPIPSYITGLPAEALATPFGQMLRPMIAQMEGQMRNGGGGGGGAFGQPWGGNSLSPPRNIDNLKPDRMVDPASNPTAPHSMLESAAALTAQAINHPANSAAPSVNAAAAPAAVAAAGAASSSSTATVSTLKRSGAAKPLTSADKKAKSFQVLIKANSKKPGGTPLTAEQDVTLTELVNTLSSDAAVAVKSEGNALLSQ